MGGGTKMKIKKCLKPNPKFIGTGGRGPTY